MRAKARVIELADVPAVFHSSDRPGAAECAATDAVMDLFSREPFREDLGATEVVGNEIRVQYGRDNINFRFDERGRVTMDGKNFVNLSLNVSDAVTFLGALELLQDTLESALERQTGYQRAAADCVGYHSATDAKLMRLRDAAEVTERVMEVVNSQIISARNMN